MEKLIIDTDFETDCDDAGALAILHGLADRGLVEPLGIVASVNSCWPAAGVRALNLAFGRPELPVGCNFDCPDTFAYRLHRENHIPQLYHWKLVQRRSEASPGRFRPEEAVALYRRLLENAPDHSVTICAIGLLSSLAALLESGASELIRRKVKLLVTMAEATPPESSGGFNWEMNRRAAGRVLNHWPGEIAVSPMGRKILTGAFPCADNERGDFLRTAYSKMGGGDPKFLRPSWDHIAVLFAAGALGELAGVSRAGTLRYDSVAGLARWREEAGGNVRFLEQRANDDRFARFIQEWMAASCR